MKKLALFIALLLVTSGAHAASIPGFIDPKAGPEVWVTDAYNNSSSALSSGDIVIWDIDASTGDDRIVRINPAIFQ